MTDQELIQRVAIEVMGWVWSEEFEMWVDSSERDADGRLTNASPNELIIFTQHGDEEDFEQETFNPLTNLNHAFMILEKMRQDGWLLTIHCLNSVAAKENEGQWGVSFWMGNQEYVAFNNSLGHAICLAALAAVGEKK